MKCVATWSFAPWLDRQGSGPWTDTEDMLACAIESVYSINKFYGKPIIYTDTLGKSILSEIINNADIVDVYTEVYKKLPTNLWAYSKLLTYADQKKPYFHFDLDFIILKNLDHYLDVDIMFQNYENILEGQRRFERIHRIYNIERFGSHYKLPEIFNRPNVNSIYAANVGCLYMKNLHFNKLYTDTAIKFVNDNIEVFSSENALHMCVVEQQILGLLLHDHPNISRKTLLQQTWISDPYSDEFFHFIGRWKKKQWSGIVDFHNKLFGHRKNEKTQEYAKILDNLRLEIHQNKNQ